MLVYYLSGGEIRGTEELTPETIKGIHGMKVRLTFLDNSTFVGYCDILFDKVEQGDCIRIWTAFTPQDGFFNSIDFNPRDIKHIEALLYSGCRWGGGINFRFPIPTENAPFSRTETISNEDRGKTEEEQKNV